jgi:predicted NBD/HSP70 family sugar kinase
VIRGLQKVDLAYVRLASSEIARDINRDIVLEIVRGHQPISRAELSRMSGLQPSTVSEIVNQLIEERWVREGAMARLPRGRRPTMVGLNDNLVMLVADVRPELATIAVVDLNGRFLSRAQLPVTSDPKKTIAAIVESMLRMKESHPGRSFEGVGIALPGRVDSRTQRLRFAPNLGWKDFDIKSAVEKGTGMVVEMENAANACLLAETWFGRMDGVRNAVLVTISEGLGTGLLCNGQLIYGDHNMAGEYGHVPMDPNGPKCGCGSRGCWEVFASNRAALRSSGESGAEDSGLTFVELLSRADHGDARAVKAIETMAHHLGRGMRMIVAGLSPERIIVIGDLTRSWRRFGPVIEAEVQAQVLPGGCVPAVIPTHEGGMARLRGTVALVLQKHFAAP